MSAQMVAANGTTTLVVCEAYHQEDLGFSFRFIEFPIIAWKLIDDDEGHITTRAIIPGGDFRLSDFAYASNEVTYAYRFPDGQLYQLYHTGVGFPDGPCTLESIQELLNALLEAKIAKQIADRKVPAIRISDRQSSAARQVYLEDDLDA